MAYTYRVNQSTVIKLFQICCIALMACFILACSPNVPTVAPKEAATQFSSKQAIIIDVREQDEWDAQHIEGAILVPLDQVESRLSEFAAYKDKPIIMQCRSGRRSHIASTTLINAGFTKVYNLEGGILAWDEQGLPTVKSEQKKK